MRYRHLFAAAVLAAAMTAGAAFAQPPEDVNAVWDAGSHTLTVTASHPVNDKTKHFVMAMTVTDGNKQIFTKRYTQQGTAQGFSEKAQLNGVKPGDKLTVELVCNIMGVATKEITVK